MAGPRLRAQLLRETRRNSPPPSARLVPAAPRVPSLVQNAALRELQAATESSRGSASLPATVGLRPPPFQSRHWPRGFQGRAALQAPACTSRTSVTRVQKKRARSPFPQFTFPAPEVCVLREPGGSGEPLVSPSPRGRKGVGGLSTSLVSCSPSLPRVTGGFCRYQHYCRQCRCSDNRVVPTPSTAPSASQGSRHLSICCHPSSDTPSV